MAEPTEGMQTGKGGTTVGGGGWWLSHLINRRRKSFKTVFSRFSEDVKLFQRSNKTIPSRCLHLNDKVEETDVSSIKERNAYYCASSLTNEEGCVMTTPGVVARLMGLDAIPCRGVTKPIYTSSHGMLPFRGSHNLNRSAEYYLNNHSNYATQIVDSYMHKPLDPRANKMSRSPIKRYQLEALPPSLIKNLSKPHHTLLSPIKNPGSSSGGNMAQIMEAAPKILEPKPQVNPGEKSICEIPSKASKSRRGVPSSQRKLPRQPQSSMTKVELTEEILFREKHINEHWNCNVMPSIDSCKIENPGCPKSNKRKAVYVLPNAEFSMEKREGLAACGRNSGLPKQHNESRTNQHLMIQSEHQTNKQQEKSSSYGAISPVLRKNYQKRNSLVSTGKLAPKRTVSTQQGRKVIARDSSSGRMENGSKSIRGNRKGSSSKEKDFPQNKSFTERNSTNEKVPFMSEKATDTLQKKVQPNVAMDEHIKWNNGSKDSIDVASFTFTSSVVTPLARTSRLVGNSDARNSFGFDDTTEKHYSDKKVEGLSPIGLNSVNGDSLSLLLESKLKALTLNDDPSINFISGDSFLPAAFTLDQELTSPCINCGMESGEFEFTPSPIKYSLYVDNCQSAQSSTKGQLLQWSKPQVQEPEDINGISNERKEGDGEDLNESCWSSQWPGSSNGSKIHPSSFELNDIPMDFLTENSLPVDMEEKMMDLASSKSTDNLYTFDVHKGSRESEGAEMDYIEYTLGSVNHSKDELGKLLSKHEGWLALDPLLFEKLEELNIHTEWKEPLEDRVYRRLLFDCLNECFETRRLTYSWEGYVAWSKGMIALSKDMVTEVHNEICGWKSMGERTQDELLDGRKLNELVEKDMSSGVGKWVDFPVEALEVSEEMERDILSSLLDEVIGDICAGRRQRR